MGKTILYIEDNLDNRILVKRVLEVEGYHVIEAETGLKGLSEAKANTIDLVLIDINLPDIDGYEVTRRLRQMPQTATVPIIAMTANVMKGDREKTLEAGCNNYIRKPIDIDQLPQQVAEYV